MTEPPVERLSAATLPGAHADSRPTYDRTPTPTPTIAHLGVGAFARAHLGAYADDLLGSGYPAMIHGISLRSPRAEAQLGPQDGLYSLAEREPGGRSPMRIIGSYGSVATGPEAAVEAIAAPTTTLVTLTITEKGYEADLAPSVLARGLARRRADGSPPVIASLDNLLDNGGRLRERVVEVAAHTDPDLARWIDQEVRFPNSVVDRIVPATSTADLDEVERSLGLRDEAAVVAERYCSWVIEDADGLPPLADVGVDVVSDVGPHQRRKLWLLNAPHSALAYGGLLAGCDTIAAAAADQTVASFVARLVDDVLEVADVPEPRAFADEALWRFRNPALGHTCRQVGADGSQKLQQRLLPVVAARQERGLSTDRFAIVAALWSAAVNGVPLAGRPLPPIEDPATVIEGVDSAFLAEVKGTLDRLMRDGIDVLRESA